MTEVDLTTATMWLPRLIPEFGDGIGGDDRGQDGRLGDHQLDLRHQPVDLHVADDAAQTVSRADVMLGPGVAP